MKRVLCIRLPNWPSQRLAVTRPESEEPSDPAADREALEALAQRCERFSPTVAVEDSAAPDSLLLDVTGLAHLFGGESALAEKVVDDFARRGLSVEAAMADTIGAAWAVAHWGTEGAGGSSQGSAVRGQGSAVSNQQSAVSNQGSGVRTLNTQLSPTTHYSTCLTIIPPGQSLAALRPLPVAALRLSEETVELLRQLGIDRIGQLEMLPRDALSSRFAPELLRRWDQTTGRLAEPMPTRRPSPLFQADWSADHPTTRRETVEAVLEPLIARVAAMLRRFGQGALRLECRLDAVSVAAERAEPLLISVGLFEPTASAKHLFELVQMQMERLRLAAPVAEIRVTATATAPLEYRQQELFFSADASQRSSSRRLAGLVDRLGSRLGRRSVVRAQLVPDAQPERAWRRRPLLGGPRRRRRKVPPDLPPRPLRLLPRPIALRIASDGLPLRFHFHGHEHRIAHAWGPERIETGWWRGGAVARDYYQIETTTGRRFWLFRRLGDGRWFVHGMFE